MALEAIARSKLSFERRDYKQCVEDLKDAEKKVENVLEMDLHPKLIDE